MTLLIVGSALGVDWGKVSERMKPEHEQIELTPMEGPSIADLRAAIETPPVPRGSTLAASIAALKKLGPVKASSLH